MQPRRFVAAVFFANLAHVAWRDMSRAQLLRGEMAPHIGIDAMTVFDTKGTLDRAQHGADTLAHWVDQTNARCGGCVGSGHSVNGVGVLSLA